MADIYGGCGEYGELDELFASIASIENHPKAKNTRVVFDEKNVKTKKRITLVHQKREKARINAKKTRERRKAAFQALIEYSKSLHKQNEKLKQQIYLLKEQLKKLLMLCREKH
jgi:hypothetical protein